jgi:hypothetical protein
VVSVRAAQNGEVAACTPGGSKLIAARALGHTTPLRDASAFKCGDAGCKFSRCNEMKPVGNWTSAWGKKGREGVWGGGGRRGWSHCRQTSVENRLEKEEGGAVGEVMVGWMQTVSRIPWAIEIGRGEMLDMTSWSEGSRSGCDGVDDREKEVAVDRSERDECIDMGDGDCCGNDGSEA